MTQLLVIVGYLLLLLILGGLANRLFRGTQRNSEPTSLLCARRRGKGGGAARNNGRAGTLFKPYRDFFPLNPAGKTRIFPLDFPTRKKVSSHVNIERETG